MFRSVPEQAPELGRCPKEGRWTNSEWRFDGAGPSSWLRVRGTAAPGFLGSTLLVLPSRDACQGFDNGLDSQRHSGTKSGFLMTQPTHSYSPV